MNISTAHNGYFVVILLAALLVAGCAGADTSPQTNRSSAASPSADQAGPDELKDAPDFTLRRMNGEAFTLSEHEGQVVVLNIWATWCPPCREEIPDFIQLQQQMRDEGVLFVGVSQDREGWEVVRPFAEKYGINYPLLVDDGTIRRKYGPFRGIPTTFIINKQGKVEYVAPGMVRRQMLQPVLKKLAAR